MIFSVQNLYEKELEVFATCSKLLYLNFYFVLSKSYRKIFTYDTYHSINSLFKYNYNNAFILHINMHAKII